jgi:serine/threonine-protein kinase
MSDVFVSYKAEDRRRVAPLVQALQANGFSVWWDAQIGGGDEWRRSIEQQLDAARCVLVVWSKRSTGPEGRFVRDEASRAMERSVYLPVRIDNVRLPLGFGETQALNLTGWRGSRDDGRYQAVLAAARAIAQGRPHDTYPPHHLDAGVTRRGVLAGGALATIAAAGVGGWFLLKPGSAKASESIAVLPFANLSGDPSQAYFSDGLAEELRTALARIPKLKVMARTSSEAVRNDDVKSAAQKLGVGNILTGSVRRSPSTIRISAQLVDGSSGLEHWSDAYDRAAGDALKIQTEIAQRVAEALSLQLAPTDRGLLTVGGTNNPKALDLYLQAIAIEADGEKDSYKRSINLFDAAIQLDQRYAEAYAQKATAVAELAAAFPDTAEDFVAASAKSAALARQSIALEPKLAMGYAALGRTLEYGLDFRGALTQYRQAVAQPNPGSETLRSYGNFLGALGYLTEALKLANQAIAIDPLNPRTYAARSLALFYGRRFADAAETAHKVLQLSPKRAATLTVLGNSWTLLGKTTEARAAYSQVPADNIFRLTGEAILEARLGNRSSSDRSLARVLQLYGDTAAYQEAEVRAQRGELNEAFTSLNRAVAIRDPGLIYLTTDPFMDPIRGDARFKVLVDRLNFPTLES